MKSKLDPRIECVRSVLDEVSRVEGLERVKHVERFGNALRELSALRNLVAPEERELVQNLRKTHAGHYLRQLETVMEMNPSELQWFQIELQILSWDEEILAWVDEQPELRKIHDSFAEYYKHINFRGCLELLRQRREDSSAEVQ